VYDVVVKSSCSLSHLPMCFLLSLTSDVTRTRENGLSSTTSTQKCHQRVCFIVSIFRR